VTKQWVLRRVRELVTGLAPTVAAADGALRNWRRRLAELLHRHPELEITGLRRPHDSAAPAAAADLENADLNAHLDDIFARPAEGVAGAAPLVFRRETPASSRFTPNTRRRAAARASSSLVSTPPPRTSPTAGRPRFPTSASSSIWARSTT
jgi:hypothetical protein